ncbi:asparagine synthase (glutamine-hydrolyzing), partial [Magnetospirillum sp. SS-4]|uniref:asparagine synthase (glutamine-hydrolyzing) n=1 Tax=Magnetospirillum sp. SS-4 TaxID=2681465 RepID=UPI001572CEC0
MCGIAGILDISGEWPRERLTGICGRITDRMVHRGPDDGGVWADPAGGLVLGHRRLSIIDTSVAGHQPMEASDGASAIAFNGEIYNFQELRRRLEAAGETFSSHSDTEVLLAGLRRHGADFVRHLDGMYAFAWWKRAERTLLLARDPFGEKPLYTYRSGPVFAFASELAPLSELPDFDDRIEVEAMAAYCMFQYIGAPRAIYRAAAKVPPGAVVRVGGDGATEEISRYRFRTSAERASRRSLADLGDELEEILVETIRTRMISDVPLGAFLSSGVDSSTVVALAARRLNRSLDTFSIGFEGTAGSEHEDARAMARWLGTRHEDEICSPDIGSAAVEIGTVLDEPNSDSSCLPTHLLSRLTRRKVTVALSGDGGDEMFGGYDRYFSTLYDQARFRAGELPYPEWRPDLAYYSTRLLQFPERDIAILFGEMPPGLAAELAGLRQA